MGFRRARHFRWAIYFGELQLNASRSCANYGRVHRDVARRQRNRTQHNQDGSPSRTVPRSRLSERRHVRPEWKHSFSDPSRKSRGHLETYRRDNSPILRIQHTRHRPNIKRNAKRYREQPLPKRERHRFDEVARHLSLGNRAKRFHERIGNTRDESRPILPGVS